LLCKNRAITGSGFSLHSQANGFAALQVSAAFLNNASAAVTVSAAKTNARRLVVAVKDAVAAQADRRPKKSYKYKFSFFSQIEILKKKI